MDTLIFKSLYSLTNFSPFFDGLIIFLGKTLPYFLFLYFLYLIFKQGKKSAKLALKTSLSTILSIALASGIVLPILHFILQKPRPFVSLGLNPLFDPLRDNTLPSGHATFFFVLATIALFSFSKKSATVLYVLASIVAIARVIAGLHWPSDILLGSAIGIAVALCIELSSRFFAKTKS